ncbi:MutS-related protein [Fluviicola taffensis]|uniref:DNA mismatch repair protein MutS domain protein n=1 Tax=Fluviicola taffensis (strain DSM 16823 / NCIMB 13979 / RW262) TaxID=755732 RepID=F2IE27_FLUTR|nr:DNA mismatch repair protein MutS [Fluviicola taffensis]AEA45591.1 DNA mismatch repair protein MutS domain protein [Fluviicola taffensis DSM 16823]
MIPNYNERAATYKVTVNQLNKKLQLIGWSRLIVLVISATCFYFSRDENGIPFLIGAILSLGLFSYLINIHFKTKRKRQVALTYLWLNNSERAFIDESKPYYEDGNEFLDTKHPYSFDIDLFGPHSLFQHLNRTSTVIGSEKLAQSLLQTQSKESLNKTQEAIQEISEDLEWRQAFQVYARLGKDSQEIRNYIDHWQDSKQSISILAIILAFIIPALGLTSMILLWQTGKVYWFNVGVFLFTANMLLFGAISGKIRKEIGKTERIGAALLAYSEMLQLIENRVWKSARLQEIHSKVHSKNQAASALLKESSRIYENMDSINNGMAVFMLNGTIQFHVHVFRSLVKWKKNHRESINQWIEQIAEIESLLSFSNFSVNNPEYTFPNLQNESIFFEELGHPLLSKSIRVSNSIDFSQERFVILTGSNMSGKSTFLRTLGIGIILSNAGSVIPAKSANFSPLPLLVSMRLSDSLEESTSYFFSEVKRLKLIIDNLKNGPAFVLLDEILRGTNSDDKQNGTIGIVEQMVRLGALGMIATHDLEVCETTNLHPTYLKNKCFEVEIRDNDLFFDYKLRNGICQNKSATFIMKKYQVI